LDENHPHKKITNKKNTIENPLLEVAFDYSQSLCHFSMFRGLFIGIKRILETLVISENLKVSLLVQVEDWKSNPIRKNIPNSSRFAVLYCGAFLA
jgi:hypothetical protein